MSSAGGGTGLPRAAFAAAGAAVCAGVVAVGWPAVTLLAIVAVLAAAWVAVRSLHPAGATPVLAAAVGAGLIALRVLVGPAAAPAAGLPSDAGPWLAVVDSVGAPRDGQQTGRLRLQTAAGPVLVAASMPAFPVVRAGALVEVDGRLRPPPEDDPYGDYLRRSGAAGSLDANGVRIIASPEATSLQGLRDAAGDALRASLPEPEAGLAAGILIGLKERVDRTLAADFATAGASHVVAISGWNIAIVAALVGAVLRGRPRRLVAIAVGATVVAYVIAAGASASVVRAAVMAGVVLAARETGRAGRAPAALALAALVLLVLQPELIGDAGFRLSVMATAGLLAWATPLGAWLAARTGGRLPGWLTESLGISLAAQAATLPDVLLTFGRLSLVSPVVNLLVVPLVPVAMGAGVLALLAGGAVMAGAPALAGTLAGLPAWLVLHVIVAVVRTAAALPMAAIAVSPEAAPLLAGASVVLVVGLSSGRVRAWLAGLAGHVRAGAGGRAPGPRTSAPPGAAAGQGRSEGPPRLRALPSSRLHRAGLGMAALVAAVATLALGDAAGRATRLVILDVGQGDAILLESRTGSRVLVDGGPDPDRLLLQLDARIPPWDRRIDALVLTHPHEDHVAGLVRVLERYSVGRAYEPGMHGPGTGWEAWDTALRASPGIPRATLAAGSRITAGEIRLDVIWPTAGSVRITPGSTGRAINDTSIILLGTAGGHRFLLTGDAEEDVDPSLIAQGLPHLDVLKVAHHGSATATSAPLLDATRPTLALISVGAGNDYGHPAPSTLDRLRAAGAEVHRTDREGTLVVSLGPGAMTLQAGGARRSAARTDRTGYDPRYDRAGAPRGRLAAALPGSTRVVHPPRLRRGRCRGNAGGRDQCQSRTRGRGRRRGCGAAARCGQAPCRGPGGRSPPRRGLRGLARDPCHARARRHRPGPPGHAARGRR